ncbi:antibiotic biosynthesis monooxygenase [Paenibacillus thermoaerophilus]|nr:antibiotic biosynthesis monooxygenase [Paenibacillus thermoaerophilus]TMV17922.1 antibiotic biosynthesis monooxygenase [Paenibacillus thermoaerophilus]
MFVVVNTIRVKPGMGEAFAERFREPKGIQSMPGFVRMEFQRTVNPQEADYEEFKVCTTWESKEHFEAWTRSDSFRQAHEQRKTSGSGEMMLGAKLSMHEVLFTHLADSQK